MINTPKKVIQSFTIGILLTLCVCCCSSCAFSDAKIVKPSPVEVSLLKALSDYPNYNLEELKARIETLTNNSSVKEIDSHAWDGDVGRTWVKEYLMDGAEAYFWIYDNVTNAKNALDWEMKNENHRPKPTQEKISNDVEVVLYPVFQYRNSEMPRSYDDFNCLYTLVRIGNVIVDISEVASDYEDDSKDIGVATNNALAQICKALKKQ
jgi:hypothetical protein